MLRSTAVTNSTTTPLLASFQSPPPPPPPLSLSSLSTTTTPGRVVAAGFSKASTASQATVMAAQIQPGSNNTPASPPSPLLSRSSLSTTTTPGKAVVAGLSKASTASQATIVVAGVQPGSSNTPASPPPLSGLSTTTAPGGVVTTGFSKASTTSQATVVVAGIQPESSNTPASPPPGPPPPPPPPPSPPSLLSSPALITAALITVASPAGNSSPSPNRLSSAEASPLPRTTSTTFSTTLSPPIVSPSSDSSNSPITQITFGSNPGPALTSLRPAPLPTGRVNGGPGQGRADENSKASNKAPLIGGIIAGCSGIVLIFGLVIFYIRWRRKRSKGSGNGASRGAEGKYSQFDRDNFDPTSGSARMEAAIDWRLNRTRDNVSNAKRKVFPKREPLSANTDRENNQFIDSCQRNSGFRQRFDLAKARIVGWRWGSPKQKRHLISMPEMRGALGDPPVANSPFILPSATDSAATIDFSQLLQMEERERHIELEGALARVQPGLERSSSSARQTHVSQPVIVTPHRASVNPNTHRRSSTVGVGSWYERTDPERSRRYRSDPFDLEGFETEFGLLESGGSKQGGAGSGSPSSRGSSTSRYSKGSSYYELPGDYEWTNDRRWSLGSAQMPSAPGMAF